MASDTLLTNFYKGPVDVTIYPVSGDLTEDGVQYSTEVSTGSSNTDVTVLSSSFEPGNSGTIKWGYINATVAFKANTSATAAIKWKIQAKDQDESTWQDLCDYVTYSSIGTDYVDKTISGYIALGTYLRFQSPSYRVYLSDIAFCYAGNVDDIQFQSPSYRVYLSDVSW